MRISTLTPILVLSLTVGCASSPDYEDYYIDRKDPTFSGLSVGSEEGNIGGFEVTIAGSGFGDSADEVVVLLGHHNVEVTAVADDSITFMTPPGPVTGGPVDLVIATPTGYLEQPDAYTYDVGTLNEAGTDIYADQEAFILVQNLWTSCYMGLYDTIPGAGCDGITYGWFGEAGVLGQGEFYRFVYPRLHTAKQAVVTGADASPYEWWFDDAFDSPYLESSVEDLRRKVVSLKLENPDFKGEKVEVDLACDSRAENPGSCDGDDVREYDLGELEFCETFLDSWREPAGTGAYESEWPVRHDFFAAADDFGDPDPFMPVDIDITAEVMHNRDPNDTFPVEATLTLPGSVAVYGTLGFDGAEDDPGVWALSGYADCLDGDGDGEAYLDEEGQILSWEPIPEDVELGGEVDGEVVEYTTYVMVSVSRLYFGWFGGEGWTLRGSVVVPDYNEYDDQTGLSSVGIPNWVMYQFPTPNMEWSGVSEFSKTGWLGDHESGAAYVVTELFRITDYRIPTTQGAVIFSYVTGDVTFSEWENPIEEGDTCGNCLDDDEDGWTDTRDPDCNDNITPAGTEVEDDNNFGNFTCNDGIDNDNDGLTDAEDTENCQYGWDGETNCGDGEDNDDDGWIDLLDADCLDDPTYAAEDGALDDNYTCSNGLDDDGDGWIDSLDPGCTIGTDSEDDGFDATYQCNDNLDNDDHGDIDALDPYCSEVGGMGEFEQPEFVSRCADDSDNDDDGFVDELDPDCEYSPFTRELSEYHNPKDYPLVAECYDGLDNDLDGAIDAMDTSCWNPLYSLLPDGFLDDEAADHGEGNCANGIDDDADGWPDGTDPDCVAGDLGAQTEVGFGSTECNDGINNDGDKEGLIDAADPDCKDGHDNFEGA